MHIELWLMHRSCEPASRSTRKAFTLASWFPPSHPMQIRFSDLQVWVFEQCATLHHQHIASHQLQITAQGPSHHGIGCHPAVAHPQPTLRQAEELYRSALSGREDQLGPVHPSTLQSVYNLAKLLEAKGSFAEARGISVGWCCCLGRFCLEGM